MSSEWPAFNKTGDKYLASLTENGVMRLLVVDANTGKETVMYEEPGSAANAGPGPGFGASTGVVVPEGR